MNELEWRIDRAIEQSLSDPWTPHRNKMVGWGQSFTPLLYNIVKTVNPSHIFEWGPGQSTCAFLMGSSTVDVTSYEYFKKYSNLYRNQMNEKYPEFIQRWHLITAYQKEEEEPRIGKTPEHIAAKSLYLNPIYPDKYFDIILIDGQWRRNCIKPAHRLLKDNGVVLVHDCQHEVNLNKSEAKVFFEIYKIHIDPLQQIEHTAIMYKRD